MAIEPGLQPLLLLAWRPNANVTFTDQIRLSDNRRLLDGNR